VPPGTAQVDVNGTGSLTTAGTGGEFQVFSEPGVNRRGPVTASDVVDPTVQIDGPSDVKLARAGGDFNYRATGGTLDATQVDFDTTDLYMENGSGKPGGAIASVDGLLGNVRLNAIGPGPVDLMVNGEVKTLAGNATGNSHVSVTGDLGPGVSASNIRTPDGARVNVRDSGPYDAQWRRGQTATANTPSGTITNDPRAVVPAVSDEAQNGQSVWKIVDQALAERGLTRDTFDKDTRAMGGFVRSGVMEGSGRPMGHLIRHARAARDARTAQTDPAIAAAQHQAAAAAAEVETSFLRLGAGELFLHTPAAAPHQDAMKAAPAAPAELGRLRAIAAEVIERDANGTGPDAGLLPGERAALDDPEIRAHVQGALADGINQGLALFGLDAITPDRVNLDPGNDPGSLQGAAGGSNGPRDGSSPLGAAAQAGPGRIRSVSGTLGTDPRGPSRPGGVSATTASSATAAAFSVAANGTTTAAGAGDPGLAGDASAVKTSVRAGVGEL
jgi:hypothetical protein